MKSFSYSPGTDNLPKEDPLAIAAQRELDRRNAGYAEAARRELASRRSTLGEVGRGLVTGVGQTALSTVFRCR